MPKITVCGRNINYHWARKTDPTGPVLVLLNGLVTDTRVYEQYYLDLVERGFDLIMIDNTNRGESTYQEQPITLAEMEEEILAVLDREQVSKPVWIGQSAFAGLALRLASRVPSAGLVLESPIFTYQNEQRIALLKTLIDRNFRDESLMEVAQFLGLMCLSSAFLKKNPFFIMGMVMVIRSLYGHRGFMTVWKQIMESLIDGKAEFAGLSCPLLVVYGDEEFLQPRRTLRELIGDKPNTLVEIPSGHFIISEAPDRLFGLIEDFMKTQVARGSDA